MKIYTGIDIVDINHIQRIYKKFKDKFIQKLLTSEEQKKISSLISNHNSPHNPSHNSSHNSSYSSHTQIIKFLARRFAAKEAIVKALQTGICPKYNFKNISVLNNDYGAPIVYINQKIQNNISLSLSDNKLHAIASCVLYENDNHN